MTQSLAYILAFLPLLATLAFFSLRRQYNFKNSKMVLLMAYLAKVAALAFLIYENMWGGTFLHLAVQTVVGLFLTLVLMGLMGSRVSSDTYSTIIAIAILYPIAEETSKGFAVFILIGAVITFLVGFLKLKKFDRLTSGKKTKVNEVVFQSLLESGITNRRMPVTDNLPLPKDTEAPLRTSLAPGYSVATVGALLITILLSIR